MNLKFLTHINLNIKLNAMIVLAFGILLVGMVVVTTRSVQNLTTKSGQERVQQEAEAMQKRFEEAEEAVLSDAKFLANAPGLVEAVANRDVVVVQTIALLNAAPLELAALDLAGIDGVRFVDVEEEVIDIEEEPEQDMLLELALLGIEITDIVFDEEPLLAAAVPLHNTSGEIVGALLVGRKIDDKFLQEINFSRSDIQLVFIAGEEILAVDNPNPAEQAELSNILLDKTRLEQALSGRTVIADDLWLSTENIPHALAYAPLKVGRETRAVIGVIAEMDELFAFQNQLISNTTLTFTLLALVVMGMMALLIRQSITVPISSLKLVAERMADGDYSQPASFPTNDEIGQLADAFGQMAEAIQAREAELRKSEEQFRLIFELAPIGMVLAGLDATFWRVNQALCDTVGYTAEELQGRHIRDITHPDDLAADLALVQKTLQGEINHFRLDKRYIHKNGQIVHIISLVRNSDNQPLHFIAQVVDISERKRVEEQIKASLQEKEVLLKEIHHRVKNNLQVISSLLYLQSKKIKDPAAFEMFTESQNRVKSMGLIHEKLYQSRDLAHINFADYIRQLTRYLFRSYRLKRQVTLQINADEIFLTAETAIPCALIINELLSNALKHAFPTTVDKPQKGEIRIDLSKDNGQLSLIVADNGIGLPQNVDFQKPQASLGATDFVLKSAHKCL
jgi:PAS domain S-box-containing protein